MVLIIWFAYVFDLYKILFCRHILWSSKIVGLGGCETVEQGESSVWFTYRTRERGSWWCKTQGCDSWDGWCNLQLPLCRYWWNSGRLMIYVDSGDLLFTMFMKACKDHLCCLYWDCLTWWTENVYGLVHIPNKGFRYLCPNESSHFFFRVMGPIVKEWLSFTNWKTSKLDRELFFIFWIRHCKSIIIKQFLILSS